MNPKKFIPLFFALLLVGCSVQKRHYVKGLYVERFAFNTKSKHVVKYSFQEKLHKHAAVFLTESSAQTSSIENEQVLLTHSRKKYTPVYKGNKHSIFPVMAIKNAEDSLKPRLRTTEDNRVPKAAVKMSLFSLGFLTAALCLFFLSDVAFYLILGVFIAAFIFALVALLTSIAADKDRIANNKKGIRLARFALILSILILCAIAAFFIFTPIIF